MAEPTARAIVRDIETVIAKVFSVDVDQDTREQLVHLVDAHLTRAAMRVLEEPPE